jgi:glycosyltransferase involved in cell wall biosynthesis
MNTRLKILIIHPALAPYRIDFFNYLDEVYEVHLIFLRENLYSFDFNQNELRSQLNGSFEFLTKGITFKSTILYRKGIINTIKRFQPEIVVSHEYALNSLQIAIHKLFIKNYKQLIWTADNKIMLEKISYFNYLRKKLFLFFADGVSVYTEDVKEIMKEKFKLENDFIGVFPNIQNEQRLNIDFIENSLVILPELIRKLLNENVILFVGRLAEVKNIPHLIQAYKLAEKKGLVAKLIIIGDGYLKEELHTSVKGNDNIIMPGAIQGDELKLFYKVADLLVLPSVFEPFGAVVNESLIYGTPVFCSINAGAKNLIATSVNGALIDPVDHPIKLADMLLSFFKNKHKNKKNLNKSSLMLNSFNSYASEWLPQKLIE